MGEGRKKGRRMEGRRMEGRWKEERWREGVKGGINAGMNLTYTYIIFKGQELGIWLHVPASTTLFGISVTTC